MKQLRIIISGGGTGGHIFPAIAIADAVSAKLPTCEILFVGAEGRMEMQRVPAAGYRIEALPVSGLNRTNPLKNFKVVAQFVRSVVKAQRIVESFAPHVVVGVGGYASGPILAAAALRHIPILIQEQNSYAGVTNKLLGCFAQSVCVAYEGMDRFFAPHKIKLTGNPVRNMLQQNSQTHAAAAQSFGFNPTKPILFITGGSLGARTLNESVLAHVETIKKSGIQVIWQCGSYYHSLCQSKLQALGNPPQIHLTPFVSSMQAAYAAADLVVARAGAGSISEFSLLAKPVILVPSPNVAEDHQMKNAMALVNRQAAICVHDSRAVEELIPLAVQTIADTAQLSRLSQQITQLAHPDAAQVIADAVIALAQRTSK